MKCLIKEKLVLIWVDLKGSYVVWVRCVLLSVLVKLKGDSSFTSNIITSSGIMAGAKLGIPNLA